MNNTISEINKQIYILKQAYYVFLKKEEYNKRRLALDMWSRRKTLLDWLINKP